MKNHQLKIKYEFAKLHFQGNKNWEIRRNDRDFQEGDIIEFTITEVIDNIHKTYTRQITNVFDKEIYGLKKGYVILSIENN